MVMAHPEWGYPEVMLIDGGIAQLNAAIRAKNLAPSASTITIISIAKGKRELLIEGQKTHIPLKDLPQDVYNLIVHLDDEAHRFAITFHKKVRKKALLQ
jgi:excinuclease ABC subunit C